MSREHPKISVICSCYSALRRAAVHRLLLDAAAQGLSGYVCISNVHTTMMGLFNRDYRTITNEASLAVPDGMPLVWAMRTLGEPNQDRVRGPSLMRDLIDFGRSAKLKHYLYGGSPEVVRDLRDVLLTRYPGALIVGAESPPFKPIEEITELEWNESAARINATGAQMVWIGLGAPKQEIWMFHQREAVKGIMLGVGAAFDLIPGRIPEAPAAMQAVGMEWAYRFFCEPRRLWRRYLFNNPAFLVLWAAQLIARAGGRNYRIPAP